MADSRILFQNIALINSDNDRRRVNTLPHDLDSNKLLSLQNGKLTACEQEDVSPCHTVSSGIGFSRAPLALDSNDYIAFAVESIAEIDQKSNYYCNIQSLEYHHTKYNYNILPIRLNFIDKDGQHNHDETSLLVRQLDHLKNTLLSIPLLQPLPQPGLTEISKPLVQHRAYYNTESYTANNDDQTRNVSNIDNEIDDADKVTLGNIAAAAKFISLNEPIAEAMMTLHESGIETADVECDKLLDDQTQLKPWTENKLYKRPNDLVKHPIDNCDIADAQLEATVWTENKLYQTKPWAENKLYQRPSDFAKDNSFDDLIEWKYSSKLYEAKSQRKLLLDAAKDEDLTSTDYNSDDELSYDAGCDLLKLNGFDNMIDYSALEA